MQVAKDTKKSVDPNYGAPEIMQMEAELGRLNLYYGQLLKQQEQLIAEMERAVQRHGDLSSKAIRVDFEAGTKGASIQFRNHLRELQRKIKELEQKTSEFESFSGRLIFERERLAQRIQALEHSIKKLRESQINLREDLQQANRSRVHNSNQIVELQNHGNRLKDLYSGKYVYACKEDGERPNEVSKQNDRFQALKNLVGELEAARGGSVLPFIMDQGYLQQ